MKTLAYATTAPQNELELVSYQLRDPRPDEVLVRVEHCGLCHSDLSMLNNDWGMTEYPFVGGHEVVGKVEKLGSEVKTLEVGQTVGVGWMSHSCKECRQCLGGHHNRCGEQVGTIIGRPGGFASHILAQNLWTVPIPSALDPKKAGPLFCGGITVFNPFLSNEITPIDRIGVIGIGGLGHLALQFGRAWGCEVTAFSSSPEKEGEARSLGAHEFVNSKEPGNLESLKGRFRMLLVTVNVELDWQSYIELLAPGGVLHFVGAAPPVELQVFPMIAGEKSFKGSPLGSPAGVLEMLDFCARHQIEPTVESFPMSRLSDAFKHLEEGKARYRVVLESDFSQVDESKARRIQVSVSAPEKVAAGV